MKNGLLRLLSAYILTSNKNMENFQTLSFYVYVKFNR